MTTKELRITHHNRTLEATLYLPKQEGKVPMIVMSHGYNGGRSNFVETATHFTEQGFGCITFNFAGGGPEDESGFASTSMTLFTEQEDLTAVLNEVKNLACTDRQHIILFGSSQGGLISAMVGKQLEEEIAGMVLLYPALCIIDDWKKKYQTPSDMPEVEEFFSRDLGRAFYESIYDKNVDDLILPFKKPVLIFHGKEDQIVPIHYSEWVADVYQQAKLIMLEQEEHGFTEEGNRKVEEIATPFLLNLVQPKD